MLLKLRNMMDIIDVLLQWYITFFKKKTSSSGIKNKIISNKELAAELHKPVARKFKKRKVQSSFIDNILEADPEDSN